MPPAPLLSVIIPCLNDASALRECLTRLQNAGADCEIIVSDASQSEVPRSVAAEFGAAAIHCAQRGRGTQLNAGAAVARGEILVFNHCDVMLLPQHIDAIRQAAAKTHPPFRCGAFHKDMAAQYPRISWIDGPYRWWIREIGTLYGDQSFFFRRPYFKRLGGFAAVPIMEDVEMSGRMRAGGGLVLLDPPIRASMRRFRKRGYWKNAAQNFAILTAYRLGLATPERIYRWYYNSANSVGAGQ